MSTENIFGSHKYCSGETNNSYQGAHTSEWACDRTIVEL